MSTVLCLVRDKVLWSITRKSELQDYSTTLVKWSSVNGACICQRVSVHSRNRHTYIHVYIESFKVFWAMQWHYHVIWLLLWDEKKNNILKFKTYQRLHDLSPHNITCKCTLTKIQNNNSLYRCESVQNITTLSPTN